MFASKTIPAQEPPHILHFTSIPQEKGLSQIFLSGAPPDVCGVGCDPMHDAAAGFERRAKGIRERVDIPAYRPAGDCAGVCAAGRSQSGAPGCVEQQERSGTYGAGADVCRSPCLCTGRDAAGGHDCGGANLRVVSGTRSFVARSHAGQRAASAILHNLLQATTAKNLVMTQKIGHITPHTIRERLLPHLSAEAVRPGRMRSTSRSIGSSWRIICAWNAVHCPAN